MGEARKKKRKPNYKLEKVSLISLPAYSSLLSGIVVELQNVDKIYSICKNFFFDCLV